MLGVMSVDGVRVERMVDADGLPWYRVSVAGGECERASTVSRVVTVLDNAGVSVTDACRVISGSCGVRCEQWDGAAWLTGHHGFYPLSVVKGHQLLPVLYYMSVDDDGAGLCYASLLNYNTGNTRVIVRFTPQQALEDQLARVSDEYVRYLAQARMNATADGRLVTRNPLVDSYSDLVMFTIGKEMSLVLLTAVINGSLAGNRAVPFRVMIEDSVMRCDAARVFMSDVLGDDGANALLTLDYAEPVLARRTIDGKWNNTPEWVVKSLHRVLGEYCYHLRSVNPWYLDDK